MAVVFYDTSSCQTIIIMIEIAQLNLFDVHPLEVVSKTFEVILW